MYRNFYGDTWEDFNREVRNRKVYLFGWNSAKRILPMMKKLDSSWNFIAVIDNDKEKQGTKNVPHTEISVNVISPYELAGISRKDDIVVLICGTYISAMAEQLESLGIKNYYSEIWLSAEMGRRYHNQVIDHNIIEHLESIMSDNESRRIIHKIESKRREGFVDYSDIYIRGSEYFRDEFWEPEQQGIFVDAGGFNGDTIEEYSNWTKGNFKHIYTFEPQKDLAEIIERKLWIYQGRVTLIKKGLWSKAETLRFVKGDEVFSGKINNQGEEEIETVSLDETLINEHVSFIKMDIEGAEVEAIKGAENIIRRDKPKMALSIYHRPQDLWEIPFAVHSLVPEYRLSIRHTDFTCSGTVLYARL